MNQRTQLIESLAEELWYSEPGGLAAEFIYAKVLAAGLKNEVLAEWDRRKAEWDRRGDEMLAEAKVLFPLDFRDEEHRKDQVAANDD